MRYPRKARPQETIRRAPDGPEPMVAAEVVVQGLESPLFLTAPEGDDRLFVVERGGRVVIVDNSVALAQPFLDVSSLITAGGKDCWGWLSTPTTPATATSS